jgi:hypothetical protein
MKGLTSGDVETTAVPRRLSCNRIRNELQVGDRDGQRASSLQQVGQVCFMHIL